MEITVSELGERTPAESIATSMRGVNDVVDALMQSVASGVAGAMAVGDGHNGPLRSR